MRVVDFLEAYHDHFLPNLSFSPVILSFDDRPVNKALKCQQEIYFITLKYLENFETWCSRRGEDWFDRLCEKWRNIAWSQGREEGTFYIK
jgi:hypothetical protein